MRRINTLSLLIAGLLIGGIACAAQSPLVLSPASSKILAPQAIDFHALIGSAGHDITAQVQSWSSSNPAVASVNSSGHLVALSPGATTITAVLGALQANAQVTVLDPCLLASTTPPFTCGGVGQSCNVGVCNPGLRCSDSDSDGLSDAWEMAGGIDFNADGVVDDSEKVLTNVDPVFPDGTPNPHPSADPGVKDIFVLYDWMELPDQLTNGQPTACTVNALPGPPNFLNIYYPYHSDQCAFDQHCISGVCRGHSDEPDPAALMMVIQAFAAHDIRLHLVKGHALPHANVIAFGPPVPACVASTSTQTFSGARAVDFFTLKAANFNAAYNGQTFDYQRLFPVFHYAIFGHRNTCDSPADCVQAACLNTTGYQLLFNETGLSERPGNDIIVSLGGWWRDRNVAVPVLALGGTFMHELGHNLGLDHGGPLYVAGKKTDDNQIKLNYKPNYISVMNYNHQGGGIGTAASNCAPSDYVCKTTPVSTRLDYSSFSNGVVPNTLDENNGNEAAGINLGTNDIGFTHCASGRAPIPGTGPVDFNCNGTTNDTWCANGCTVTPGMELNFDPLGKGSIPDGTPGSGDVLQPFEDWPNLVFGFQCSPHTFSNGAVGGAAASGDFILEHQLMPPPGNSSQHRKGDAGCSSRAPKSPPQESSGKPAVPLAPANAAAKH